MRSSRRFGYFGALFILGILFLPPECLEALGLLDANRTDGPAADEVGAQSEIPNITGDVFFYFTGDFIDTCGGSLGHDGDSVGAFWTCGRLGEGSGQGTIDESGEGVSANVTLFPHGASAAGATPFNFEVSLQGEVAGDGKSLSGTWESPLFGATGEFIGLRAEDLSGVIVVWGDVACSGEANVQDAIDLIRSAVPLAIAYETLPCPFLGTAISGTNPSVAAPQGLKQMKWGDFNCDGLVDTGDALPILLDAAGIEQTAAGCPPVGEPIQLD